MRNWSRILALGHAEARFLVRCWATIAMVRLNLSLKRHATLRRRIDAMRADDPATLHDLCHVSWGVSAASRYVPAATCLTQALAGQHLLAKLGKTSIVRIGVERDTGSELKAHAWLISGDHVVLGGPASTFASFNHLVDYGNRKP